MGGSGGWSCPRSGRPESPPDRPDAMLESYTSLLTGNIISFPVTSQTAKKSPPEQKYMEQAVQWLHVSGLLIALTLATIIFIRQGETGWSINHCFSSVVRFNWSEACEYADDGIWNNLTRFAVDGVIRLPRNPITWLLYKFTTIFFVAER
jgi:hypothetical protein